MINLYPGFDVQGNPILFDPQTSFSLYPEIKFDNVEPNSNYFIYSERSGKTFIQKGQAKEYYMAFGALRTDKDGNWINMQYMV